MENKNEFNSFSLINYIWQWRKLFLIICFAAGVLSFFFSTKTFIRPQFKATTIIYAPRTNSVSQILTNERNPNERLDIKAYAEEEATEQMMQILNSREIKDMLIERYDLVNYYGINIYKKAWKAKLYETLDGFMKIRRTSYGAISITVTDWDPERAAQMANDIASELDTLKNRVERERALSACKVLENLIRESELQRKIVTDSLLKIAEYGVFTYEFQVERVIQQHAIAIAQGNTAGVQRLQKELEKLEKWGPVAFALRQEHIYLSEQVATAKIRLMAAQMDLSGIMPVKFVIEKAVPTDKKSFPKKIIISIVATIGTFFLTLLTLLFIDKIREEIEIVPKPKNKNEKEI